MRHSSDRAAGQACGQLVAVHRSLAWSVAAACVAVALLSSPASAQVGCNALAVVLRDVDGFVAAEPGDFGFPEPSGLDKFTISIFEAVSSETRIAVFVGEFERAADAELESGDFGEALLSSAPATVSSTTVDEADRKISEGSGDFGSAYILETVSGRHLLGAALFVPVGVPLDGALKEQLLELLRAQEDKIPDHCRPDIDKDGTANDSQANWVTVGAYTGVVLAGVVFVVPVVLLVRRGRSAPPDRDLAP